MHGIRDMQKSLAKYHFMPGDPLPNEEKRQENAAKPDTPSCLAGVPCMNHLSEERLSDIRDLLASHPQGLSINEISARLHRHRNSVSRDLHALSLSGQVVQHAFGTTRVYSLSRRVPITSILHYIHDMVLVLDNNGVILSANAPLLAFLSCTSEALKGVDIKSKDHPLLAAICAQLVEDSQKEVVSTHAFRICRGDEPFFLKTKMVPIVFENGKSGVVCILTDITNEIRSKEALKTSKLQYMALVDAMPEMVAQFLPDGTIISANDVFSSFFSLSLKGDSYGSLFSLIYPEDTNAFLSHLATLSPEQPTATVSFRVSPKGGLPVWHTWVIQGLYDKDSMPLVYQGIGHDITEELVNRNLDVARTRELAFVASKSREFMAMDPVADMYECIASHITEMIPGSIAAVFEIDSGIWTCTLKATAPRNSSGRGFLPGPIDPDVHTCSLAGKDGSLVNFREALLSGSLVHPGGFLLQRIFPQGYIAVDTLPDQERRDTDACSAGLVWEGSLYGAIEVILPQSEWHNYSRCLDTYLGVASLALQKRMFEHALRTSEERFKRIATTNPHPISIIDSSGRYIYLSPRFTELFGYTQEDIPTGREWFMQAFPDLDEQKRARETWKMDLAESRPGEIRPRQFRVRCKDGLFKEISFLPVGMSNGQQLIVYEDVTPRLEAVQTRNLLFDIFRSSHDGIFSATIDGRILSWNPAAERIYGYSAEEVEGGDVCILEPPSLKGEIPAILERVRRGEHIVNFETQRIKKDGKLIDVSLTVSPIYSKGRTIMGASTIIRDITARKSEERLRRAEMQYRELVDNINVGVYRSTGDPEGRFVWGNTSLLRILGYDTLDDLQDIPVSDMFMHAGGRADLLAELMQQGFVKNREIILKKADGSPIHVLVTALATFAPEGSISHINGIVEDITSQRVLEQKVARLSDFHDEVHLPVPPPPRD